MSLSKYSIRFVFFSVFFVGNVFNLIAAVYYVAPIGGNNNFPGNINQPWATWQKAFETAEAGDTVYFRGGVWYPSFLKDPSGNITMIFPTVGIGNSGNATNPICYFNYPGETPVLDCSGILPDYSQGTTGYNTGLYIQDLEYVKFRGLTIRNVFQKYDFVKARGISCTGTRFLSFDNIVVHNIGGQGIFFAPNTAPDTSYFTNCDVHHCIDTFATGDTQGGWGDGWQAIVEDDSYLVFTGNRAWMCSDDGINLTSIGTMYVHENWSFLNGIFDGDGCGFKLNNYPDNTDLLPAYIVTNNLAAYNSTGNTAVGFTENNNGQSTSERQMYNNTSYMNNFGFVTLGWNTGPQKNNDYRNNIAYNNFVLDEEENEWSGGVFFTDTFNTWNDIGVTVTDDDFISLDGSELTEPRKEDGSLPDINFLNFVEESDLIDAGMDVGLPFIGNAPDLGYSEYLVPVTGISVSGESDLTTISTDNGTLQLSANVEPENAVNQSVTWMVYNGSGQATVSSSGLVTAISDGDVRVRAIANDGSGVYGEIVISITNQTYVFVTDITVISTGGTSTIENENGTLQLFTLISPDNADIKTVTWLIFNESGQATISPTGLVTAISNGNVRARAIANDGSEVYGELELSIINQFIPVTSILVTGVDGTSVINADDGVLQLNVEVLPPDATNKYVTWSISNVSGLATIDSTGMVTAIANGEVTARASSNDGSGVYGEQEITIRNQFVSVTNILVTGENESSIIDTDDGTLQLNAEVLPVYASNRSLKWLIENGTGEATISNTGLVTAISDGTVTAVASSFDGSNVSGSLDIAIYNQDPLDLHVINNDNKETNINISYFDNQIRIDFEDENEYQVLYLFDVMGKMLIERILRKQELILDLPDINLGIYFLVLAGQEEIKAVKLAIF
jgi:uncharacterized protein YjdB